jgi:hypothetical protein
MTSTKKILLVWRFSAYPRAWLLGHRSTHDKGAANEARYSSRVQAINRAVGILP